MKILFLIPHVFIPPNKGNKQLTFNLLKYVTEHADCDLVVLTDPSESKDDVTKNIKLELPHVRNTILFDRPVGMSRLFVRLRSLLYGYPPAIGNYWNESLAVWLKKMATFQCYDVVHFDMFYMAQYRKYCKNIPSLLIPSDAYSFSALLVRKAVHNIIKKLRMTLAYLLIVNHERNEYKYFNMICPVADVDSQYLKGLVKNTNIRTVGVAISSEFTDRAPRQWENAGIVTNCELLYIGAISQAGVAEGLREFLHESFPKICASFRDTRLVVLGRDPLPWLKNIFAANPMINHIDFVDDYVNFLDNDWIYIHPQQTNAGFQTKVQHAMALGLPVVGYELAFTGMEVESDKHCFKCDSLDGFTKNILGLLRSATHRRKIGLAASEFICNKYSVTTVGEIFMEHYRTLLKQYN